MRRLALFSALLAVAAGCGGKHGIALQLSGVPSSSACDKKGISTKAEREGTCVVEATTIRVANRGHSLRMQDYAVRVARVRTASYLGRRAAENFLSGGEFVVLTLSVQNTGTTPQRFDKPANLAFLLVDKTEYLEVPGAEKELPDSFHAHGRVIAPGGARTGTIVFDLPADQAKKAQAEGGYAVFLNPEDAGNGYPRLGKRAIGFVRLWK